MRDPIKQIGRNQKEAVNKKAYWREQRTRVVKFFRQSKFFLYLFSSIAIVATFYVVFIRFSQIEHVNVIPVGADSFAIIDRILLQEELQEHYRGRNFFTIKPQDISEDLGQDLVSDREISVEKLFPHTIIISIEERVPVLQVVTQEQCVIIDYDAVVLDLTTADDIDGCKAQVAKYTVFTLKTTELNIDFDIGVQSTFYDVEKIILAERVLADNGYTVSAVRGLGDQYLIVAGEQRFTISRNQDISVQMKRLYIVLEKIDSLKMEFTEIDLRFKRPIVRR